MWFWAFKSITNRRIMVVLPFLGWLYVVSAVRMVSDGVKEEMVALQRSRESARLEECRSATEKRDERLANPEKVPRQGEKDQCVICEQVPLDGLWEASGCGNRFCSTCLQNMQGERQVGRACSHRESFPPEPRTYSPFKGICMCVCFDGVGGNNNHPAIFTAYDEDWIKNMEFDKPLQCRICVDEFYLHEGYASHEEDVACSQCVPNEDEVCDMISHRPDARKVQDEEDGFLPGSYEDEEDGPTDAPSPKPKINEPKVEEDEPKTNEPKPKINETASSLITKKSALAAASSVTLPASSEQASETDIEKSGRQILAMPRRNDDYAEGQQMELEELESIFFHENELEVKDPQHFILTLLPFPDEDEENHVCAVLDVRYPATYPEVPAEVTLVTEDIDAETKMKLPEEKVVILRDEVIARALEENADMPMMYLVAEAVREYLRQNNENELDEGWRRKTELRA